MNSQPYVITRILSSKMYTERCLHPSLECISPFIIHPVLFLINLHFIWPSILLKLICRINSFVIFLTTENLLPLLHLREFTPRVLESLEAVKEMICGGRNAAPRHRKPLVNNPTAKTSNISHPLCRSRTSGLESYEDIEDNRRALSCKHSVSNVITAGDL